MFGLKPKPAEVLSHWAYTPVPTPSASTSDFYAAVEKELKAQKVPGLTISRVELSEGGILTDNRQYFRMTRERLVFDVCAAPSARISSIPAALPKCGRSLNSGNLCSLWVPWGLFTLFSVVITVKVFGLLAPFVWPPAYLMCLFLVFYALRSASLLEEQVLKA